MKTLIKIILLFTTSEQKQGLLVLLLVIILALLETLSVLSVMPFLSLLGNPTMMETNATLITLYKYAQNFGVSTQDQFFIFLGFGSFFSIVVSSAYRVFTNYMLNSYIEMRRESIASRLLEIYLRQPYSFFLDRHSADMSKTIISEVDLLVSEVLYPTFNMLSYSFVVFTITLLLIWANPWLALLAGGLLGGLYAMVYVYMKQRLLELGTRMVSANKGRFMAASEVFGGIKNIKLLGREYIYRARFQTPSNELSRAAASQRTLSQAPKFVIEAFAFGGIILVVMVLIFRSGGLSNSFLGEILPIIGLYAFSAYRLQPALQNVFVGVSSLRSKKVLVENLYTTMCLNNNSEKLPETSLSQLKVSDIITIEDIHYTYPNSNKQVLKNINFQIPFGSTVGIIGTTGAGKTTLVDILLGLLSPSRGRILVDGVAVEGVHVRAWQRSLGYVPQDIFLTDTNIYENIALGVPKDQIDFEKIHLSTKMAQVHQFIMKDLPFQYETFVGERGVRLSGGQRQRIGIARALYHNPDILLFDEATSALDVVTEEAVMNSINALVKHKTIIIVAHRLTTLKNCDQIVLLNKGKVQSIGSYSQIIDQKLHLN